jgi:hypothetical protein
MFCTFVSLLQDKVFPLKGHERKVGLGWRVARMRYDAATLPSFSQLLAHYA